jgi:hypothetical protein
VCVTCANKVLCAFHPRQLVNARARKKIKIVPKDNKIQRKQIPSKKKPLFLSWLNMNFVSNCFSPLFRSISFYIFYVWWLCWNNGLLFILHLRLGKDIKRRLRKRNIQNTIIVSPRRKWNNWNEDKFTSTTGIELQFSFERESSRAQWKYAQNYHGLY